MIKLNIKGLSTDVFAPKFESVQINYYSSDRLKYQGFQLHVLNKNDHLIFQQDFVTLPSTLTWNGEINRPIRGGPGRFVTPEFSPYKIRLFGTATVPTRSTKSHVLSAFLSTKDFLADKLYTANVPSAVETIAEVRVEYHSVELRFKGFHEILKELCDVSDDPAVARGLSNAERAAWVKYKLNDIGCFAGKIERGERVDPKNIIGDPNDKKFEYEDPRPSEFATALWRYRQMRNLDIDPNQPTDGQWQVLIDSLATESSQWALENPAEPVAALDEDQMDLFLGLRSSPYLAMEAYINVRDSKGEGQFVEEAVGPSRIEWRVVSIEGANRVPQPFLEQYGNFVLGAPNLGTVTTNVSTEAGPHRGGACIYFHPPVTAGKYYQVEAKFEGHDLNAVNGYDSNITSPIVVRDDLERNIEKVKRILSALDRIRVFYESTPGSGHHSSTSNIVRRLIKLGFKGTAELWYLRPTMYDVTATKIVDLALRACRRDLGTIAADDRAAADYKELIKVYFETQVNSLHDAQKERLKAEYEDPANYEIQDTGAGIHVFALKELTQSGVLADHRVVLGRVPTVDRNSDTYKKLVREYHQKLLNNVTPFGARAPMRAQIELPANVDLVPVLIMEDEGRLRQMFPEFGGMNTQTQISGATLELHGLADKDNPVSPIEARFGFSGGSDYVLPLSHNEEADHQGQVQVMADYLHLMNVKHFLGLQPYKWKDWSNTIHDAHRPLSLRLVRPVPGFDKLGYHIDVGLDPEGWRVFQTSKPADYGPFKAIHDVRNEFHIMTIYGLTLFEHKYLREHNNVTRPENYQVPRAYGELILFNFLSAVERVCQRTGKKAIVLILRTENETFDRLNDLLALTDKPELNLTAHPKLKSYVANRGLAAKTTFADFSTVTSGTIDHFRRNPATNLHVVKIPGLPGATFDEALKMGDLPRVFEGQGTWNTALKIGKPYFHLRSNNNTAPDKPTQLYSPTAVSDSSGAMNTIIDRIQASIGRWEADLPGSPPDVDISNVMFESQSTVANPTKSYFDALCPPVRSGRDDKLLRALFEFFGTPCCTKCGHWSER